MRHSAQIKGGFYPIPPEALAVMVAHLRPPKQQLTAILDPCCGKGAALAQLGQALGRKPQELYGVELEPTRGEAARAALPGSKVLAPADFLNAVIGPYGSFGMLWCNPPFDDEIGGGGRVEYHFLARATQLVAVKGIMAFVCPEPIADTFDVRYHFLSSYEDIRVVPFPEEVRRYREVVIFGRKKARSTEPNAHLWDEEVDRFQFRYEIPPVGGPQKFLKGGLTEEEALEAMSVSRLRELFQPARPIEYPTPPLELSKGQMALVLAGGFLNTTLQRGDEPPILIKATPYKEQYLREQTIEVKNEGGDKEQAVQVSIYSERIKLKVRVAEETGVIHDVQ